MLLVFYFRRVNTQLYNFLRSIAGDDDIGRLFRSGMLFCHSFHVALKFEVASLQALLFQGKTPDK